MIISCDSLLQFTVDIFEAAGVPRSEAAIVAEHLVEASLTGYDTHGVMRIPQYIEDIRNGVIRPGAPLAVEKETATTAIVDCGWNFGQVGGLRTIDVAIAKACRSNTAFVVARRCNHAGRLGAYTTRAAQKGFIAFGVCNSPRHGHFVSPWGGREGRLATNPISFAFPCNSGPPMLADFSTAETSEGAIRLHRNQGKLLHDCWILNAAGKLSNDPNDFYGPPQGSILPFGGKRGYRGFALSLLVEVLGGLLGGSRITTHQPGNGLGFIVLNVSAFVPLADFEQMLREVREYIKSSSPAPGFEEVMLPGEPDDRLRHQRLREGIPIDENTWQQIEAAAASVSVSTPSL